jgi:non-specific serine/threonine protein kinase
VGQRRTLTLWQLDIADRAMLDELNPELLHRTIGFCENTVDRMAEDFGLSIVQPMSVDDSLVSFFESASEAIEMVSEVHRMALEQPWHPARNLLRSAILSSDCELKDGMISGGLRTLECMKDQARPGQILISQATYALARENLPENHRLLKLGSHHFDDQLQAQFLYQLLHPDLPSQFRALASTLEAASNLPTGTTPFIGRISDLERIIEALREEGVANLIGFGGIGKSRLAIEVGHDRLEYHNHGVAYIDFTGVFDQEEAYRAILNGLGLREDSGRTLEHAVIEKLKKSEMLLIFDNVNTGSEAVSLVINHIQEFCREVQILVTSRIQLNITKCAPLTIGPMEVPNAKKSYEADELLQIESVRLFQSKVRLHDRDFDVNSANVKQVAQICRALDGVPLSIELAAAKLARFDIAKVADGLQDVFSLLRKDKRAFGQPALEAVIEWSYDVLKAPQRNLFVRLAIFEAAFDLEAAHKVAGHDLPESDVKELIEDLVSQAFIVRQVKGDQTFYQMLGTVREFGRNRAIQTHQFQELMDRYAAYYTELAKDIAPRLYGSQLDQLLVEMDYSYPNFVAVLKTSIANFKDQKAPSIILALYIYWHFRSLFREGLKWCQTVLHENRSLKGAARCKVLIISGIMAANVGNYKLANRFYTEAKAIADKEDDPKLLFSVLGSRGNYLHLAGDYAAACEDMTAALEIARSRDDQVGIADITGNLANAFVDFGEHDRAVPLLEESQAVNKELGREAASTARASFILGRSARLKGDLDGATDYLSTSLQAFRDIDNIQGVAGVLREFALLRVQMRSFHSAAMFFGAEETRRRTVNVPVSAVRQLEYDAAVAETRSELGGAFVYDYQRGIDMSDEEIFADLFLQRQIR